MQKCIQYQRVDRLSVEPSIKIPSEHDFSIFFVSFLLDVCFPVSARVSNQRLLGFWKKITSMNLFDSDSNNVFVAERERKMTGLYIFLLAFSFTALAFYTGLPGTINTYAIKNPSQSDYLHLQAKYSDTLECPCRNSRIRYSNLIQISIKYHQICTSNFVAPFFIAQLFIFNATQTHPHDFMGMSGVHFTHMAVFCQFYRSYINTTYASFLDGEFIASKLVIPEMFETQLNSELLNTNSLIQSYLDGGISSAIDILTNSYLISSAYTSFSLKIATDGSTQIEPTGFLNCSCIKDPKTCSTDAAFYAYSPVNGSLELLFKMIGLRLGCSPFQSTFQSSLACWYSLECYQTVRPLFRFTEVTQEEAR